MTNYVGVRCPVCNKKFTQNDDIVVCPTCGAPHHRECYLIKNECAFAEGHLTGNIWRATPEKDAEQEQGHRTCSACGTKVPDDALFCQVCGANLNQTEEQSPAAVRPGAVKSDPTKSSYGWDFPGTEFTQDPIYTVYGGVNPEEEVDGLPIQDVARYVGGNSAYYMPRFKIMDATGKTISPNFAAMFGNFLYYFYRKMYLIGFLMAGLYVVSMIPSFLYTWEIIPLTIEQMGMSAIFQAAGFHVPAPDQVDLEAAAHYLNLSNITSMIHFAIGAILSLCSNRIYFERCIKAVRRLRDGISPSGEMTEEARREYHTALDRTGGTSKGAVLAVILTFAALFFISSFIIIYIVLGGI